MSASSKLPNLIRSTAGAVPVVNEKGELTMQKVKVSRYVSGRRPEYAPQDSDSESSEEEEGFVGVAEAESPPRPPELEETVDESLIDDRRLRRLRERAVVSGDRRARDVPEPEVIYEAEDEEEEEEEEERERLPRQRLILSDSESSEEELDDAALELRREMMREKARRKALDEDLLDLGEEKEEEEGESEESSEYEEYTDSEDDAGPRLKPVFVRKLDRVTIREKEEEEKEEVEVERERKRQAELRKRESQKLVSMAVHEELQGEQGAASLEAVVVTDEEEEEEAYEAWKVRELKRIKRDREERERIVREREEIERMRNLTEEERLAALKANPKVVTNKSMKGKYKFLQKYYHRGAFYLDKEENVLRRNISEPTLEDHFDKTVLPKVMQVKNFGRAGRTKYTHLVDQDTTQFDNAWSQTTPLSTKFQSRGGGMKQNFEKPSHKKRKMG